MSATKQLFLDYYRIGLQVKSKPVICENFTYTDMLKLIKNYPPCIFTQIVWAHPYELISKTFKDDIVIDGGMQCTNILSNSHVQITKCFCLKNKKSLLFAILDSHFPIYVQPRMTLFETLAEPDRDGWIMVKKLRI